MKLITLAQEIPWFYEAVINAKSTIEQMGLQTTMVKEYSYLTETMKEQGWE